LQIYQEMGVHVQESIHAIQNNIKTTTLKMEQILQNKSSTSNSEWGTFKDSLKAPIYGWFTYPAGFSYKAVEHSISLEQFQKGVSTVYDPFMGSGTTNLACKKIGLNSIGVEAHPFVYKITETKMNWEIDENRVGETLTAITKKVERAKKPSDLNAFLAKVFPELVLKCFLPETLFELYCIREEIKKQKTEAEIKNFLNVALICVLRDVSIAQTGWPYIAPNKIKITSSSKNGLNEYISKVKKMLLDVIKMRLSAEKTKSTHQIFLGDSRNTKKLIKKLSIDHIFTSPPYLNNFDYADRTRLEMYFMGDANNWSDISEKIRSKLMTSATTQINRSNEKYKFNHDFIKDCPHIHTLLAKSVMELGTQRLLKGGKKSYDLMTVGYFNDLYEVLKECYRVLKSGRRAVFILGDSAPYGVHIPTDVFVGEIGKCIGFKDYGIEILRVRGGKWAKNPQRHSVPLRESIVTLYK
jgi:DNA modification methylase